MTDGSSGSAPTRLGPCPLAPRSTACTSPWATTPSTAGQTCARPAGRRSLASGCWSCWIRTGDAAVTRGADGSARLATVTGSASGRSSDGSVRVQTVRRRPPPSPRRRSRHLPRRRSVRAGLVRQRGRPRRPGRSRRRRVGRPARRRPAAPRGRAGDPRRAPRAGQLAPHAHPLPAVRHAHRDRRTGLVADLPRGRLRALPAHRPGGDRPAARRRGQRAARSPDPVARGRLLDVGRLRGAG